MTLTDVFVPEFGLTAPHAGFEMIPGLLSEGVVEDACPSRVDGVNAEGDEMIGEGENCNEDGVKGAGVTPSGREGCSGL